TSFGAMLGFGRLALGIAVLFLCLIWVYHKEYRHIWVGLCVGSIQGTLDMFLMIILWYQPYDIFVHLFDIFIYSTWLLLFRIEKLDYNGLLFYLMLTTLFGAFLELLAINLTSFLGINLFYPPGWNGYLSLIYFGAMSAIGLGLYLFIYDRELIKKLMQNELWND
ncbi:MAG: hypothetical protein ACFFCM_04055, partial [Promethearchaeota archaeon]